MTEVVKSDAGSALLERVVMMGDLEGLKPAERVSYYQHVCESLGLNPLTQPFSYIKLNGKLTLYARKDATEQLRMRDRVSVMIVNRELVDGVYIVTARATTPDGRTDESIGAVSVEGLKGEAKANAMMKAETKGKRRVTLSICGLGMLDETEVSSIPDARTVRVDMATGEIVQDQGRSLHEYIDRIQERWKEEEDMIFEHYPDEYEALIQAQREERTLPLESMTKEHVIALGRGIVQRTQELQQRKAA